MDNEEYQVRLEKCSKEKFLNKKNKYSYQGDVVSGVIFSLTKKFTKKEGSILDVGAGTGAFVSYLKGKGYKNVLGVDLYPKVDFVEQGKITELKFENNSFDAVFCTEVLEHLTTAQLSEGLNEVNRVIKESGFFVVTVPFDEILDNNSFVCPACGHKFHQVGHMQSFDKKRMANLLGEKGFLVKKISVIPLSLMAKLPFPQLYWKCLMLLDKRLQLGKTMLVIAQKITQKNG